MQAQEQVQVVQQKLESSYAINSYIYYAITLLSREWGVFPKQFFDEVKEPILYTLRKTIDDPGVQHMTAVLQKIATLIKEDVLEQVCVYILNSPQSTIDQALCCYQVNVSYKKDVIMVVENRKSIVKDFNEGLSKLMFQVHAKKGHLQIEPKRPFYISIDIIQMRQDYGQGLSTLASRFSRRKRAGLMKSQLAFSEATPTADDIKLYHSKMGTMLSSQDDSIAFSSATTTTLSSTITSTSSSSSTQADDEDAMQDDEEIVIESPAFTKVQTVDDIVRLNKRRNQYRENKEGIPNFKLNASYHALQSELDMLLSDIETPPN